MSDTTTPSVEHPESDYQTIVVPEVLTDGSVVYVANHPELRGCRAQADDPDAALANLSAVFLDYMQHFREQHLPLPASRQKHVHLAVWRQVAKPLPPSQPVNILPSVGISSLFKEAAREVPSPSRGEG